mgnify:CR=1 FL=1
MDEMMQFPYQHSTAENLPAPALLPWSTAGDLCAPDWLSECGDWRKFAASGQFTSVDVEVSMSWYASEFTKMCGFQASGHTTG